MPCASPQRGARGAWQPAPDHRALTGRRDVLRGALEGRGASPASRPGPGPGPVRPPRPMWFPLRSDWHHELELDGQQINSTQTMTSQAEVY